MAPRVKKKARLSVSVAARRKDASRKAPRRSAWRPTPELAVRILDILEETHPEARCALDHRNPYELTVATILSAQCTDERVNMVTPALFDRFPTVGSLAATEPESVEPLIRSTGFFRAKAKSIVGFARALVQDHGGQLPRSVPAMTKLPGIGRKTANVVLGHAYGINEGIAVDTHVLRVTNRLGLAKGDDPLKVEAQLMALVPQARWTRTTDLFIFHGRKICDARRPACGSCPLFALCRWEGKTAWALAAAARPVPGRRSRPPGRSN
jgi:endonuclease III